MPQGTSINDVRYQGRQGGPRQPPKLDVIQQDKVGKQVKKWPKKCFDEHSRRSLSSLQTEETTFRKSRQDRRASAPPVRRASCVWGHIWDLRDLLSRKRKFSSDYQVRPNKNLFSFYIIYTYLRQIRIIRMWKYALNIIFGLYITLRQNLK